MNETKRGFGVASALPADVIREAARQAEALGYDSFWVNYAGNDGLVSLAVAAAVTTRVRLGIGVIPLTGRSPASIADGVRQLDLPLDRLLLGIGSGGARGTGAVAIVRDGIGELRTSLPVELIVAALGPRMSRLAGEVADGVLFNWLTPEFARVSADWVREGAAAAGRRPPLLATYVRAALGPAAAQRLATEAGRYTAIPSYGDHFQRMGTPAYDTAVHGDTPEQLQAGLAAWDGVLDEIVVRAVTARDTVEELSELLEACRP
jgi:alkanesulfonate monooxygenase SsuD/methylene tetrahydromethanopterin reductase-like flavin-dependent oxidoreductase (luciferase family)